MLGGAFDKMHSGRTQFKGIEVGRKIILADSYSENTQDKKPLFALGLVSK